MTLTVSSVAASPLRLRGALVVLACLWLGSAIPAHAHHVLGRPSYSLNEDSNTPPSMAVETQIGDFFVTYMVFPAFPRPNEPGRLNLYVSRIDNGAVLSTQVTFSVRDDVWFGSAPTEVIGTQSIDDGVYRQGFLFKEPGKYLVTASFDSGGEPYAIDFPLQVGAVSAVGPIGVTVGLLLVVLIGVNLFQRKRIARARMQQEQGAP